MLIFGLKVPLITLGWKKPMRREKVSLQDMELLTEDWYMPTPRILL